MTSIAKHVCLLAVIGQVPFVWAEAQSVNAASPSPQPQSQTAKPASPAASSTQAFVHSYCVTCHNERLHTASLALDKMDFEHIGANAEVWEKVVSKIRSGTMPPPGLPRPDQTTTNAFAARLEAVLDRAAAAKPHPVRIPIHRLNRTEYANAVRDLLGIEVDSRSLLVADDVGKQGFDNVAGVLSVSPTSLERYISAARKISRLAVGDMSILPGYETYDVPKLLVQDDRVSDDLPFGSRGGVAIHHRFPLDGEYVIKVRLRRQLYHYIIGLGRPHQLEVRLDGKRIKIFTIGGDAPGKPAPASFSGNVPGDPEWETYMHFADDSLEVRFQTNAGTRVVGVSFLESNPKLEGVLQPIQIGFGRTVNEMYDGNPAVEQVAIGGPYHPTSPGDTPSRRRIFICKPVGIADEEPCAKKILASLARHAYRRPVEEEDIRPLMRFYISSSKVGGFEAGIQSAIEALLTDAEFLFRIERDQPNAVPGTVHPLDDFELASRLSFFLWSSLPDDELLDVATSGKLNDSAVLRKQVLRILSDSRSKALVDNFVGQWLKLTKLASAAPDPQLFPDFDENLRQGFEQETRLFVQDQFRSDRSVMEMLSANYTFVNARLARHYGLPNILGDRFRKVTFGNDERGGLLGQGSIMMITSYPNRTSPVLRGKWLLDNVLGTPPPPPPADVPPLNETNAGRPMSMREQMEEHRRSPACSGCHVRMDPLGFALENFDAIGSWRVSSDQAPIDATGIFPDGTQFSGIAGLRKLLLGHREEFIRTFIEKLLAYALGRDVEYYDRPTVRKIQQESASSDYRWSSIILGIVKSAPFQMTVNSDISPTTRSAQ